MLCCGAQVALHACVSAPPPLCFLLLPWPPQHPRAPHGPLNPLQGDYSDPNAGIGADAVYAGVGAAPAASGEPAALWPVQSMGARRGWEPACCRAGPFCRVAWQRLHAASPPPSTLRATPQATAMPCPCLAPPSAWQQLLLATHWACRSALQAPPLTPRWAQPSRAVAPSSSALTSLVLPVAQCAGGIDARACPAAAAVP